LFSGISGVLIFVNFIPIFIAIQCIKKLFPDFCLWKFSTFSAQIIAFIFLVLQIDKITKLDCVPFKYFVLFLAGFVQISAQLH